MNKREFIKTIGVAGLGLPLALHAEHFSTLVTDNEPSYPEGFWAWVRSRYDLKSDYINLENGYYNIIPADTMETYLHAIKKMNREGSYYMRTKLHEDKQRIRETMADFMGISADELIITRNTTESMDTVISGFNWKAGDEAVMAEQDYGSMLDMFRQQARRFGIVNTLVNLPLHPASDEEIVSIYEKAITPKTRMLMICHMINISGQILPVQKICEMAHRHGVKVLVDGAHAVGHFEFSLKDLNCDYYAASLHKWLGVPLGAGILYVRKDNIRDIWPLFGESAYADDDIRKLNHTGTIPMHTELCIPAAIAFHQKIGGERKEKRLRFLQTYWSSQVRGIRGIQINTPEDPQRACAIANVGLSGMPPAELAEKLLKTHGIWTVAIDSAGVKGCRITPNVYTTLDELDRLVSALKTLNT